jgi:outer membrane protein assembly factor BamB
MSEASGAVTRRELLERAAACGVVLAGLGASDALGAAARRGVERPASWPSAAHDLSGHRFVPGAIAGLYPRWRLTLGGGVVGAPAVAGGVVYAASVGGDVVAASLRDGRVRWRRRFPTVRYGDRHLGFLSAPALGGGRIFVASDRMRSLDMRTGRTIWAAPPLRSGREDDFFWGSPVVVDGLVIAGSGAGSERPTARGRITAYRAADGRRAWSTPMVPRGGNGGGVLAQVTVDPARGSLYAGTGAPYEVVPGPNPGSSALVELALRDGRVRWVDQVYPHDARGFDFNSPPMLIGRLAVAANKDGIFGWDRIARRRLWHTRLTAVSAKPGGKADPNHGPEGASIATDGHRVYATSNAGDVGQFTIAALAPWTGRVRWRRSIDGVVLGAPVAVGRTVVVATGLGAIFQVDGATGRGLDDGTLAEPTACGPIVSDGLVVVGTGAQPFLPGDSLLCLGRELIE